MTLLSIVVIVLLIANIGWVLSSKGPRDWPMWVNLIGSSLLTLITFTNIA